MSGRGQPTNILDLIVLIAVVLSLAAVSVMMCAALAQWLWNEFPLLLPPIVIAGIAAARWCVRSIIKDWRKPTAQDTQTFMEFAQKDVNALMRLIRRERPFRPEEAVIFWESLERLYRSVERKPDHEAYPHMEEFLYGIVDDGIPILISKGVLEDPDNLHEHYHQLLWKID